MESETPKRITIGAAIYDDLCSFEYSIVRELLGRDRRSELGVPWYSFIPCRIEPGRLYSNHGLEIEPQGDLADLVQADTVLLPGWRQPILRPPEPFLEALREAAARGARLISICSGAFALAYAGLLDGRRATTHWLFADQFGNEFPSVELDRDALYVDDRQREPQICSSAGSAAGLDLSLEVIKQAFGITAANTVARRMVAPVHREGGQAQYVEAELVESEDERFAPVLDWLARHSAESLDFSAVARRFGFSLRTFQRRFREKTSLSPLQWVTTQRVGRARELLEATDRSVEEIAGLSGLGSAANLRRQLASHLATTPRAYRSAFRSGS